MNYNISNFMTWFISKFIELATYCISALDGIKIGNTSLLRIMIMITVLSILIPVILSVGKGVKNVSEKIPRGGKKK